ncbi:MAG: hypothetical protein PVG25_14160 [Anaerolineae bacterium]|jgi:hypothetical protein
MDDKQELNLFTALIDKILEDSAFAQDLLHGDQLARRTALYAFLTEMKYQGDKAQALDHLNDVLDRTDLAKIDELVRTLDGILVAVPL